MPDSFARMRQIIGSTAEWTASDLVLGRGEIALEIVSPADVRLKVGDGTSRFSALPYSPSAMTVAWQDIQGKPVTFPPSAHDHPPSEVEGLVDVGGKLSLALMPPAVLDKMILRGVFNPTAPQEYPPTPAIGDTWSIGAGWVFTAGDLMGQTVRPGDWMALDGVGWRLNATSPLAGLATQGAMLWFNAGNWAEIPPGTVGQLLVSQGPDAAPQWQDPSP